MTTKPLNYRGLACPLPIVKISAVLKKAASGDQFEITADDAGFEKDITAWCRTTGNTLVGITKTGRDITATIIKK